MNRPYKTGIPSILNIIFAIHRIKTILSLVLLSGFAKSPQEKMAAQAIAMQVDGVKAVHNQIVIQVSDAGEGAAPRAPATPGARA